MLAMASDSDEFQVVFLLQRLTKTYHLGSDIDNEQQGAQPLHDNQQVLSTLQNNNDNDNNLLTLMPLAARNFRFVGIFSGENV